METGKITRTVGLAEALAFDNWRSLSANNQRLITRTMEWVASVQEQKDVTFKDYVDPLRPDDYLLTLRAMPRCDVPHPAPGDPVGGIGAIVIEYRPGSQTRVGRVLCLLPSNKLHPYVIWDDCRHSGDGVWATAGGTYFETATEAIEAFGQRTTTMDDGSSER